MSPWGLGFRETRAFECICASEENAFELYGERSEAGDTLVSPRGCVYITPDI